MTAEEALKITMNNNQYREAVEYGIKLLEEKIEMQRFWEKENALLVFMLHQGLLKSSSKNMEKKQNIGFMI